MVGVGAGQKRAKRDNTSDNIKKTKGVHEMKDQQADRRINDRVTVQLKDGTTMCATIIKILRYETYIAKNGKDTGFINESHILTKTQGESHATT
jgi:hypothetical protein